MEIKWQDTKITAPNWFNFNPADIMHMPVRHAVNLFSNGVPVVIKEGERYILYASIRQPEPYKEYGNRLKAIRHEKNYTTRALAKMLGLTGKELCDIELGRVEPPQRVVDFYGRLQ
jgi:predicted transcriptional regulator